ncbi:MAG: hypothetical protein E4G92_04615 [Bacteroidia bacterium]|nr:MAG: hypothetical protein E4G92_04615 [Bacteroidia bacterium]
MSTPEFQLLLLSLRIEGSPRAVIEARRIIETGEIMWDDLYQQANYHNVRPQLLKLLNGFAAEIYPSPFRGKLETACRRNLYNQLSYIEEFFRVRQFLNEAGIHPVPFKGFWLGYCAYGNLADRESGDVDVFIRSGDLEKIRALMEERGYRVENAFSHSSVKEVMNRSQEYNFDRIEEGVSRFHIEFHWGICPPDYGMGITLEELESQITTTIIQGQELEVFTPSANLLLTLMHHGGKDRFGLLKQILDIALIMKDDKIDWSWVRSKAIKYNLEPVVYVGANLATRLTGIDLPEKIRVEAVSKKITRLTEERLRMLMTVRNGRSKVSLNFSNWLFRMRSRTGLILKTKITIATGKEVVSKFLTTTS